MDRLNTTPAADEAVLREAVGCLADGAPESIAGLDRRIAERAGRIRRRRLTAVAAAGAAVAVAATTGAVLAARPEAQTAAARHQPGFPGELGCPDRLTQPGGHHAGGAAAIVPDSPFTISICAYDHDGSVLQTQDTLTSPDPLLQQRVNEATSPPGPVCLGNTPLAAGPRYLLRFGYRGSDPVDVLMTPGSTCAVVDDGTHQGLVPDPWDLEAFRRLSLESASPGDPYAGYPTAPAVPQTSSGNHSETGASGPRRMPVGPPSP